MENTVTLQDLYKELKRIEASMVTKQQLASLVSTIEILNDEDMMAQIRESEENAKHGKIKKFEY